MADSKLQSLLDAAAKATAGPLRVMPKLAPSYSDHGYRTIATLQKKQDGEILIIYAEASKMWQEGKGYTWGDSEADGFLLTWAYNNLEEIQRLVSLELHLREYVGELRKRANDPGTRIASAQTTNRIADHIEYLLEKQPC